MQSAARALFVRRCLCAHSVMPQNVCVSGPQFDRLDFMWQLFQPPVDFAAPLPPPPHTHTLSLSFPQCYFKPPHHSPPLDTTCLRSVPEEGLVFSITSVSLLDPHVAPVSLCGCWMFPTRPPRLLSPSTLEGCQHDSISLDFSETSSQP